MKNMILLALALLMILLTPLSAGAEALKLRDPGEMADRFFSNPRNLKDIGDPFILAEEGIYRVFATGGSIGFNVWSSPDLAGFEKAKALKKVGWAGGDYWAPEVFRIGEKYVMLFTARQRESGSLRTGIAFSDAAEGP